MSEREYKKLHRCLKNQDERLRRIEVALLGDEELGSQGFVNRYTETEKQVNKNTIKLQRIWIYVSLLAIGGATVFELVFKGLIN